MLCLFFFCVCVCVTFVFSFWFLHFSFSSLSVLLWSPLAFDLYLEHLLSWAWFSWCEGCVSSLAWFSIMSFCPDLFLLLDVPFCFSILGVSFRFLYVYLHVCPRIYLSKKKSVPHMPGHWFRCGPIDIRRFSINFQLFFFHPDKYFQMTLFFHTLIILEIDGSFGSFLFFQDLIFVPEKIFHLVPCIPFCCSISCIWRIIYSL
jgi:hypothetical protein